MRARAIIPVVALLIGSTACSGAGSTASGEPGAAATETAAVRRSEDLGDDQAVRKQVEGALEKLLLADTGSYSVNTTVGNGLTVHDSGSYSVSEESWDMEREMTVQGTSMRIRMLWLDGEGWMRLVSHSGRTAWPCWVSFRGLAALGDQGIEMAQSAPAPAALTAVSLVIGKERTPEGLVATTDLVAAVQLLGSKLMRDGDLDAESTATVPVDLELRDGNITEMSIRMSDLFTAVAREGVDVGDEDPEKFPGMAVARFFGAGNPVELNAPDAVHVLDPVNQDTFEEDMAACGLG